MTQPRRISVCIVNPRFNPSFMGYSYALELLGKRCWTATGALPTLAALAPDHCDVELLDENVQDIDFARLARFDVVGVTGMVVQRERMLEILARLKGGPAKVVVGGPYVSVMEDPFIDLCDVRFIGEADETWPQFLHAVAQGEPTAERYEQAEKTDMSTVPPPKYHLLNARDYGLASLQFSRGCPFQCEFCDIITIFGRKPRVKTIPQMLAEFDAILAAGFTACFLVDDNFIGDKRKARSLLVAMIEWQKAKGYPIAFYTEATINLADDPELITLMVQANIRGLFVGIETPRRASLIETGKHQNVRGDDLSAKLRRLHEGGLVVTGGFIVGFDHDDETVFDEQFEFIQSAGIANAMISLLTPIPTTPLHDRLRTEGRLDDSDPDVIFHPKLMSRETLRTGYRTLLHRLYEPETYFSRLFNGYRATAGLRRRTLALSAPAAAGASRRAWWLARLRAARLALSLARVAWRAGHFRRLAAAYAKVWFKDNRPLGAEAIPFPVFVSLCVFHWHYFVYSRSVTRNGFAVGDSNLEDTRVRG